MTLCSCTMAQLPVLYMCLKHLNIGGLKTQQDERNVDTNRIPRAQAARKSRPAHRTILTDDRQRDIIKTFPTQAKKTQTCVD